MLLVFPHTPDQLFEWIDPSLYLGDERGHVGLTSLDVLDRLLSTVARRVGMPEAMPEAAHQ
jgi:hypothetical protein